MQHTSTPESNDTDEKSSKSVTGNHAVSKKKSWHTLVKRFHRQRERQIVQERTASMGSVLLYTTDTKKTTNRSF